MDNTENVKIAYEIDYDYKDYMLKYDIAMIKKELHDIKNILQQLMMSG